MRNPESRGLGQLRLDKNENLVPIPDELLDDFRTAISGEFLSIYPELGPLYERLARWLNLDQANVFLAAGSDQAIKAAFETFVDPGDGVLLLSPTYAMFSVYCGMFQAFQIDVGYPPSLQLNPEAVLRTVVDSRPKLACIANPNSPTGTTLSPESMRRIVETADRQGTVILVDEAYYHYYPHTVADLVTQNRHLIVTRSFSKAWGFAAARMGVAIAHQDMISALQRVRPMYEINALGAKLLELMLDNPEPVAANVACTLEGKAFLEEQLTRMSCGFVPSQANFLLISVGDREHSTRIATQLRERDILVGSGFAPPLDPYIRVSVGPQPIMERFLREFRAVLGASLSVG